MKKNDKERIFITVYPIKLNVRINKRQYDRINESGASKSEYVRDAIDFFNSDVKRDIEISKLKLLNDIRNTVDKEHENFQEFVNHHESKEKSIIEKIDKEYEKCNQKLNEIAKLDERYSELNLIKPKSIPTEKVILDVLPTIQGFYNSETGITYDKLRVLAFRINISPEVLMNWIDQNEKLVKGDAYLNRTPLKHKYPSLKIHKR